VSAGIPGVSLHVARSLPYGGVQQAGLFQVVRFSGHKLLIVRIGETELRTATLERWFRIAMLPINRLLQRGAVRPFEIG
jgi:hypothetical protein